VARQPAADRGGEPRVRRALLRVPHRLPRVLPFLRNADGFVFDQQLFAQVIARGARVLEIPIPTRYFREASSVGFATSVRYGLGTLRVLARYRADTHGRRWGLLRRPAADWPEREARITRPAA
jgi:hypothetical protein